MMDDAKLRGEKFMRLDVTHMSSTTDEFLID
jgi:hypothetical protein